MKIRKTFSGNLPENKIINTNSTSETDTYSCKYLNERNVIVSSEEPTTGEEVWLQRGKNLINAPYTENNKLIITATKDDYYITTDYKCYLEKDITYTISYESDGEAGSENGTDTVQIYLLKNKDYTHFYTITAKERTLIPTESGYYYLRLDVNKNGTTHSFWNIQVEEGDKATSFELYTKEIYTKANNEYEKFYNVEQYRKYDVIFTGALLVGETLTLGNTKRFLDVYFSNVNYSLVGKYTIDTTLGTISWGSVVLLATDSATALEYYVDESSFDKTNKIFTHTRSGYFNISSGVYTGKNTAAYRVYRIETYD